MFVGCPYWIAKGKELSLIHIYLDMRTEIRRERTIEFFDENFRIDDLKRWKTAEDEMPMNLSLIHIF